MLAMSNDKLIIRPKKVRGDDGYRTFSIRVRDTTVDRISNLANQTGHSRNELICRFLEYALDNCAVTETTDEP